MCYDVILASRPAPDMEGRLRRAMASALRRLRLRRCPRRPRLLANPFD